MLIKANLVFTVSFGDLEQIGTANNMCEIVHVAAWCACVEGVVDTSVFTNRTDPMTRSAGHPGYWTGSSYCFCATSSGWSTQMSSFYCCCPRVTRRLHPFPKIQQQCSGQRHASAVATSAGNVPVR